MNYFAHAIRYLDRPYFMAGLAVPDWLSVVDRKSRVRSRKILAERPGLSGDEAELADGIQKHLDDDQWFHSTPGFYSVTGAIGTRFRETLDEEDEWRCGFLGHIVMELLLDAILIEDYPRLLDEYYVIMRNVNPGRVQTLVNKLATQEPARLNEFIPLYLNERFLADYVDDSRMLFRINQVMKRVLLNPLPERTTEVLAFGRSIVRKNLLSLLPEEKFGLLRF